MKNTIFFSCKFSFLVVKFSIYLNRSVFVVTIVYMTLKILMDNYANKEEKI